jgi:hypothetical protein
MVDLSGSSLHKALGLQRPPRLETSTARRKVIPPEVMGMRLFSVCAHFGEENAVMWKGETGIVEIPDEVMDTVRAWLEKNKDIEERVKAFLTQNADVRTCFKIVQETDVLERPVWLLKQTYVSNRAEVIRQMLSTQVEWPTDTEILLADMPPSTASEISSFFDNISGLLGVLIVSQPSDISALGMTRTIDFLRHKGIPIIGLVSMMDGYLCPSCGLVTHQLLSPKLAMEKMANDCGIPFLISIPQTPDVRLLKPYFDRLAKMVLKGHTMDASRTSSLIGTSWHLGWPVPRFLCYRRPWHDSSHGGGVISVMCKRATHRCQQLPHNSNPPQ